MWLGIGCSCVYYPYTFHGTDRQPQNNFRVKVQANIRSVLNQEPRAGMEWISQKSGPHSSTRLPIGPNLALTLQAIDIGLATSLDIFV